MFEHASAPEAPKSIVEQAAKDMAEGLTELHEIAGHNESEKMFDLKEEALFQRLAKAIEDIRKTGSAGGSRTGDDFGGMNPGRFDRNESEQFRDQFRKKI